MRASPVLSPPLLVVALVILALVTATPTSGHDDARLNPAIEWAYPHAAPAPLPEAPPGRYSAPGSTKTLTQAEVNDGDNPPDWFPDEHPPAPAIVAHGGSGGSAPCAECHLFNGAGFLSIPDLAGLPAAYIVEQVQQFRDGHRRSAERDRPATRQMIEVARKVADSDLAKAAGYYAALPRPAWYRVVEADAVPVTRQNYYGWFDRVPNGGTEPIGDRIVEVAEDTERMMYLSDPHSGVVAYVPPGSIDRGAAVVRSGSAGVPPCTTCHGADLKGIGTVPPLAGRSPAYLARALWDIKTGARSGPTVALMKTPAAGLSAAEITDTAAYLVSLKP